MTRLITHYQHRGTAKPNVYGLFLVLEPFPPLRLVAALAGRDTELNLTAALCAEVPEM